MREIILDTETTGLDPATGDRVVEIGCVEIINGIATGQVFHAYVNPQRSMPEAALAVHGLSDAFLADKPTFAQIAADFMAFIGDARLVIHNAEFDMRFLNAELRRLALGDIASELVVDTLALARRKHPGAANSLDALAQRYRIDTSRRSRHGALLDAEILAEVYAELSGGRQATLVLAASGRRPGEPAFDRHRGERPNALPERLLAADLHAHAAFVATLGDTAIWRRYQSL
jgi:DNA polymerase-3 subunit epsilon